MRCLVLFADYVDSSGLRMWVTPTLRQYDAGLIMAGMIVGDHPIIPPKFDALKTQGHCSQQCLAAVCIQIIFVEKLNLQKDPLPLLCAAGSILHAALVRGVPLYTFFAHFNV